MSNIQNIDISLQELVKNIDKNSYLIPKFQRDFVWDSKDIAELGDSIIRGYPISSLLIMPENGTLKVGSHPLVNDECSSRVKSDDNESKHYILDGQQRMTSISKLFLAKDSKYEYYFDLFSILLEKYPDDGITNDSGVKEKYSKSRSSDIFCRKFPISKDGDEQATRNHNRFISGKSIVDNKFGSVVSKFLRGFKESSEESIDKYTDYLNAVLGAVSGYSIPATVIASDSELGVVIRVFEKVNSTGKKLTLFDLINAKSFQVKQDIYSGGLSDYLTEEITRKIGKQNNLKLGVNEYLKYDEGKIFEKLDRIVRIFEIATLLLEDKSPSISSSTMLMREPEFWFETWNKMGDELLKIIAWMNDEDLVDIGQITFLEYVAAIFLANPKAFDVPKFKEEIKKHAFYLTLTGSSFSKSNLDTVEKLYAISKQMTDSHESTRYNYSSPTGSLSLTQNKVLEIIMSKSEFKAIINIFYNQNVKAKFTVDITGNSIKKIDKDKLDYHHIYPKSRVNNFSAKSIFNSIANIVIVHSNTNREEIKDKLPKEYFNTIHSKKDGDIFCEQNLINIEESIQIDSEESAEIFIKDRAEKIAEMVNSYFLE